VNRHSRLQRNFDFVVCVQRQTYHSQSQNPALLIKVAALQKTSFPKHQRMMKDMGGEEMLGAGRGLTWQLLSCWNLRTRKIKEIWGRESDMGASREREAMCGGEVAIQSLGAKSCRRKSESGHERWEGSTLQLLRTLDTVGTRAMRWRTLESVVFGSPEVPVEICRMNNAVRLSVGRGRGKEIAIGCAAAADICSKNCHLTFASTPHRFRAKVHGPEGLMVKAELDRNPDPSCALLERSEMHREEALCNVGVGECAYQHETTLASTGCFWDSDYQSHEAQAGRRDEGRGGEGRGGMGWNGVLGVLCDGADAKAFSVMMATAAAGVPDSQ
jgi:hypothetical protein